MNVSYKRKSLIKRVLYKRTLILSFSLAVAAHAGPLASYVCHGFPAAAHEHSNVALSSASVNIELGSETASVYASFCFANEGPPGTITIEYPLARREGKYFVTGARIRDQITGDFGEFAYYEEVVEGPFRDVEARRTLDVSRISDDTCLGEYGSSFAVRIDGEAATFSLEERLCLSIEEGTRAAWMEDEIVGSLSVTFAERERRTVTYEYDLGYELFTGRLFPELRYALYPGAAWSGNISEATISVRRPRAGFDRPIWFSGEYLGDLAPATFSYDGETEVFTWGFDDWDPPEFVELNVTLGLPTEDYGTFFKDLLGTYGAGPGNKVMGRTLTDNVPFTTVPSPEAELVSESASLPGDMMFVIIECEGEWWRVREGAGRDGWIRWRYVDPETGEEFVCARFLGI